MRIGAFLAAAIALTGGESFAQEKMTVAELIKKFDENPDLAKAAVGQKYTLEIQIAGTLTSGGQMYYRVKTEAKSARILVALTKELGANDKVVVTGTVKSATWNSKDGKRIVIDPAEVSEEVEVAPPQFTAEQFKVKMAEDSVKFAKQYKGKTVRLAGRVMINNGPPANAPGPRTGAPNNADVDTPKAYLWFQKTWTKFGLSWVTIQVKFADVNGKPYVPRNGSDIKIEGVVEDANGIAIVIKDAKLVK